MAYILEVLVIDESDDSIKVGYSFYGQTEAECQTYLREHLGNDDYLAAAVKDERVIEDLEEVDASELPDPEDYEDEDDEEG